MSTLRKLEGEYREGQYGVVFFEPQNFAVKVFKKNADASREHIEAVFKSEIDAYKLAMANEKLKQYVPDFFGVFTCSKVLDSSGLDISEDFHLDLSYKMKRMDGNFEKGFNDTFIEGLFSSVGIHYTKDASVLYKDGKVKCVIDFAVMEHELFHNDNDTNSSGPIFDWL
jgi:hypothetical protein